MSEQRPATGLELTHLRVLVALAEERTFTDAAIRLGLSQPAVSRSLARLEQLLGVRLVQRTTRALSLTDAGQACYDAALPVLHGVETLVAAAQGRAMPLRLGYSWAALGPYTQDVLRTWREQHPDVPLEVHRVDDRGAGLATGTVDVAIRRDAVSDPALHVEPLFDEGRLAALPAESPLARRDSLSLADLADQVIALAPAMGTTTLALWPAQSRPRRTVEVANTDEWLVAIASGEAVGVTPESTPTQHSHPGVRFVPLPGTPPITVSLVWRRGREHAATADFLDVVRACVRR